MNEDEAKVVAARLDPLLRALELLAFVSRHLHPPDFEALMASVGTPDEELRLALASQTEWPERLSGIRTALDAACDAALGALQAGTSRATIARRAAQVRDSYRMQKHLLVRTPTHEPPLHDANSHAR